MPAKKLLNISADIHHDLRDGNFRGEGRWERNVLNALLTENQEVHTTRKVWKNNQPRPPNLYDGTNEEWVSESVLMVHGAGRSLFIERDDAKAYMVQFHETPFGQAQEDFKKYLKQDRIIASVCSLNKATFDRLAVPFGTENVYLISGAMVPNVVDCDNWRKPRITWAYRNFRDFAESNSGDLKRLFNFVKPLLDKEEKLRVSFIVGLWDTDKLTTLPSQEDIRKWVFEFPSMAGFKSIEDKVDVFVNLHWSEYLNILSETRWIISPAEPLTDVPFIASMFGIPTIVNRGVSPYITLSGGTLFPEVITSDRTIDNSFLDKLNQLQTDHEFYSRTGNAYRNFTDKNATFKAYVQRINEIIKLRGWDK